MDGGPQLICCATFRKIYENIILHLRLDFNWKFAQKRRDRVNPYNQNCPPASSKEFIFSGIRRENAHTVQERICYSFRTERPEGILAMFFAAAPPGASKMAQIEDMISEFQIRKQYPPARPKCAAVLEAQRRAVSAPGQGDSFIPKSVSRES
jgi:hypothetical protein